MFIAIRSIYLQMFSKKCSPLCGLSGPPGQSLWPLCGSQASTVILGQSQEISRLLTRHDLK